MNNLSYLYDVLYEEASNIIKDVKLCKSCHYKYICCYIDGIPCKYLKSDGCSTNCLYCKLYLCDNAIKKYPEVYIKLNIIKEIAERYNLSVPYFSKEELFEEIYNE